MKKTVFSVLLVLSALFFTGCKIAGDDIYHYINSGEITYPSKITNSSIDNAVSKLAGWDDSQNSMDIVITGQVNQNLLLKLKESITAVEKKVAAKKKKAAAAGNSYSFYLDCDFSGMTGVTSFKECYFNGCTILRSVKMPDCFTEIPKYTFTNCTSLSPSSFPIVIPSNVTSIGYGAFSGIGIEGGIDFKTNRLSLGDYAFNGNYNLVFTTENSNENKLIITNCLADVSNPFYGIDLAGFASLIIDSTYTGENSDYSFVNKNLSDDKIFCDVEVKSTGKTKHVLINYPNSYTYDSTNQEYAMDAAFDISSYFTDGNIGNYVFGKSCFQTFSAQSAGTNCSILTGITDMPSGKCLCYSSKLSDALAPENASGFYKVNISNYGLSDYSNLYAVFRVLGNNYYIFVADSSN